MAKEIIAVDFIEQTYDTTKMDMWTKDQWRQWAGEPEDHNGIQILLLDDKDFYLKIMSIYYNEKTKDMFFCFDIQNRLGQNINMHFGEWKIDETTYNLHNEEPHYLEKNSVVMGFQKSVKRTYLESWDKTTIEITILDAETNLIIRELVFQINKRFVQVF